MKILRSVTFRREREAAWRELEDLITRIERRGLHSLDPSELLRLPVLYRAALSSLSVARAISLDRNVVEYLERLATRAHLIAYRPHERFVDGAVRALTEVMPATLWRARGALLLALGVLALGAVLGGLLTAADLDRFDLFVGSDMASGRGPQASTESLRSALYDAPADQSLLHVFAAFLFSHNGGVALFCAALGVFAGIPVILILLYNGLSLGAFVALYASRGLAGELWLWLLPHGVTELLAFAVSGTAGFLIAEAMLFPGRYRRRVALAAAGRTAGVLVLTSVLMLLVAALIEGYFRQLVHDPGARAAVIVVTGAFWVFVIGVLGRRAARSAAWADPGGAHE